jgi:formiminotetrahydrofolate cyclodeaminase
VSNSLLDSIGDFAEQVAAATPAPGGGSVAAYSGMLAGSLGQMVCNLTLDKPKFAPVEQRVREVKSELERLTGRLHQLIADDAASFDAVLAAYRLPKETDDQKAERKKRIEIATGGAIDVPMETARTALSVLKLLAELAKIGNPNAFSDLAVGGRLAETSVKGAYYNIGINLKTLADRELAAEKGRQVTELTATADHLAREIDQAMVKQME